MWLGPLLRLLAMMSVLQCGVGTTVILDIDAVCLTIYLISLLFVLLCVVGATVVLASVAVCF